MISSQAGPSRSCTTTRNTWFARPGPKSACVCTRIAELTVVGSGRWVASAGYDKQIIIYEVVLGDVIPSGETLLDGEVEDELASTREVQLVQRHVEATRENPEGLAFATASSLCYSCRDDHILHYIAMPGKDTKEDFALSGYNMNPNSDSWVSFSVYVSHPLCTLLTRLASTSPCTRSCRCSASKRPLQQLASCCTHSTRLNVSPVSTPQRSSPSSARHVMHGFPLATAWSSRARTAC